MINKVILGTSQTMTSENVVQGRKTIPTNNCCTVKTIAAQLKQK